MKTWLKGGLIGIIIYIILAIALEIINYFKGGNFPYLLVLASFFLGLPWSLIHNLEIFRFFPKLGILLFLLPILNFFIIGSLIGMIVGKREKLKSH